MSNSLAKVHPELVSEWAERNFPLTPDDITYGSNKRVWWKGSCGHEWQASVKARSKGEGCPICSGARVVAGINDFATINPRLVSEWSEKNTIKPTEVTVGSHKKVIWKCEHGHEWTATVKSRTINNTGCPYCSHNKVLAGFNDLASQFPQIAAEWSDRNYPLLPTIVYRTYQQNDYQGTVPTLQDFRDELLKQDEPEAKEIALAIELFTHGSLNTFAKPTNVDTNSYLICYDILDLGKQLMPIGMLVVLDSILNRITQNRAKGKKTFIFIDEIYLLFQHEYSANFLFTLWKRVRKYGAYASGITQNVDDLLQSHTARTMLANSEFIIMLNQAATDRIELAKLLNISDLQMSYITNVEAGHGLIKVGSSLVPFVNKFPTNTQLYKLMTTKPGEGV